MIYSAERVGSPASNNVEKSKINQELTYLDNAIQANNRLMESLSDRLEAVLTPVAARGETNEKSPEETLSPIGERVRQLRKEQELNNSILEHVLSRIDL